MQAATKATGFLTGCPLRRSPALAAVPRATESMVSFSRGAPPAPSARAVHGILHGRHVPSRSHPCGHLRRLIRRRLARVRRRKCGHRALEGRWHGSRALGKTRRALRAADAHRPRRRDAQARKPASAASHEFLGFRLCSTCPQARGRRTSAFRICPRRRISGWLRPRAGGSDSEQGSPGAPRDHEPRGLTQGGRGAF